MKQCGTIALILGVVVAGCATTTNVTQIGPDTYSVGANADLARGSEAGANSQALQAASKYCAGMNKKLLVVTDQHARGEVDFLGNATVQFKCTT